MTLTGQPSFEQGFPPSRFHANYTTTTSTLTILTTIPEDEAMYHCVVFTWTQDQWSGTYLSFEENTERKTKVTVTQWPAVAAPVQPGNSVTLYCSVFSISEAKSCPEVHWYGVRSDTSLENIIYTAGIKSYDCFKKAEDSPPSKSCVYQFSKNFSSSDIGTYYCAVAICGEIIFGNGTELDIKGTSEWSYGESWWWHNIVLFVVLTISLILTSVLIYTMKKNSSKENIAKRNTKRATDQGIYSAAVYTMVKTSSGGRGDVSTSERERIYAAVQALGLD
ncbi:uncharacterized protein LOC115406138 isoform X2 [Salarias fasciatus]|uniref:uncharacterized protein LOC115406138 isoform X2 n=1 Tax=Salarias fasciatus TaxID=181472 RepID=UPI001176B7FC|nr:uncharacterized protein LOC115406138 isoform X2 [Salarias fasciatus]